MLIESERMYCTSGFDTTAFLSYCGLRPSCEGCFFWLNRELVFPKVLNGIVLNCGTFLFLKNEYDFRDNE